MQFFCDEMNFPSKFCLLLILSCAVGCSRPPTRIIHFPDDRSLGSLWIMDWGTKYSDNIPWEQLGDARGTLSVPEGKIVWLYVDMQNRSDLSHLKELGPDDIQGLSFHKTTISDSEVPIVKRFRTLKILELKGNQTTDRSVDTLRMLKSLDYLELRDTQVSKEKIDELKQDLPQTWIRTIPK